MLKEEGWNQFLGYMHIFTRFLFAIIKYPYLLFSFITYSIVYFIIASAVYKLLIKLGYSPKKEKEDAKKNILTLVMLGCVIFMFAFLFISLFYYYCNICHIPIPEELLILKDRIAQ